LLAVAVSAVPELVCRPYCPKCIHDLISQAQLMDVIVNNEVQPKDER
jgi:hypothetical protein